MPKLADVIGVILFVSETRIVPRVKEGENKVKQVENKGKEGEDKVREGEDRVAEVKIFDFRYILHIVNSGLTMVV